MATSSTSWMPAHGRHRANIGTSLGRALKARKGTAATKASKIPDRDFYSFRYNFKPPSIDSTKPGTIDVKKGEDSTKVTVELASTQPGEGQLFVGQETSAKEMDCVLIYDEETGTFTLEKLDSYIGLTYDRKTTLPLNRSSGSPIPQSSGPSTSKQSPQDLDFDAQLERDLLGVDKDAEGEIDHELAEILTPSIALRQEEEEEEEIAIPPPPPPVVAAPKPKPRPTKKNSTFRAGAGASTAKPKAASGKGKAKAKKDPAPKPTPDADEEDLEFGQPTRQTKRARQSPRPSEGLALPGMSSTFVVPSTYTSAPVKSGGPTVLPARHAGPTSDSEDDWDEVAAVPPAPSESIMIVDEEADAEEEIDLNAFEAEMNQHLEESDDDFLTAAVSPEPENANTEHPMSLNRFAGGGEEASQDEDDYSSSSSDDD